MRKWASNDHHAVLRALGALKEERTMKWWVRIYDDGTGEVSQDGGDRPAPRPWKVVRVAESYDTAAEARKALDDYLREIQEGGPIIESRQVMTTKKRRGLAAMDPEQQRAIASLGGQAVHDRGT